MASANKIEKVNLVSDKLQRCDEKVDKFDMSEIKFLKHLDETLLLKLGRIKIFLQRLIKTWEPYICKKTMKTIIRESFESYSESFLRLRGALYGLSLIGT
jgi:hypothetical protein